jgi:hypothetical protein
MPRESDVSTNEGLAFEEIKQAAMMMFCAVMQKSRLPPMEVLRLSAMAVGAVYREAAEAHQGAGSCPCGWEPWTPADLLLLQQAIVSLPEPCAAPSLLTARPAGTA